MTSKFLKIPITFTQDLSTGALSYTTSIDSRRFKLEEVTIHFSTAITETVKVYRDSLTGANYDPLLASRAMLSETDFVFRPTGECNFYNGDQVKVTCTNANLTGVAYGELRLSEI